jgi:hypothetical protein
MTFNEVLTGSKKYAAQVKEEMAVIAGHSKYAFDMAVKRGEMERQIAQSIRSANRTAGQAYLGGEQLANDQLAQQQEERRRQTAMDQAKDIAAQRAAEEQRVNELIDKASRGEISTATADSQKAFARKAGEQERKRINDAYAPMEAANQKLDVAESQRLLQQQKAAREEAFKQATNAYADEARNASNERKQIDAKLREGETAAAVLGEKQRLEAEKEQIRRTFEDRSKSASNEFERRDLEQARDKVLDESEKQSQARIGEIQRQAQKEREDAQAGHFDRMMASQSTAAQKAMQLAGHSTQAETEALIEQYRQQIGGIREEARKSARDDPAEAAAIRARAAQAEAAATQQFSLDWMLKEVARNAKYRVEDSGGAVIGDNHSMQGLSGDPYLAQQAQKTTQMAADVAKLPGLLGMLITRIDAVARQVGVTGGGN